ncbi:MAG: methyltransferase [Halarcobacter sp.]
MINISFDETHHLINGKPLYETMYSKVMSFHDNIAPVQLNENMFFINTKNEKLFNKIFIKAYGFYEGIAAVCDKEGWYHINNQGKEIYSQRYSWIGNFQEGFCVVQNKDNRYYHINKSGDKIYKQTFNYTGDFKYSIAVAVNQEGKSTHIDTNGKMVYDRYFEELDVFHKGCAVAKDKNGYFHINKKGNELYSVRYKKLEPFYNGVALATNFNNQKTIISEEDISSLILTQEYIDKERILNESFSYFKYQILFSILKLDALKCVKENKELQLPNISKKIIFRWLQVENIINKELTLTKKGELIENELKPLILYWQDLPFKVSSQLTRSLQKGDEVFSDIYSKPFFNYLEDNQELQKLTSSTQEYYTYDYADLIDILQFKSETVCDIGGGNGTLLTKIKNKNNDITAILADIKSINTKHQFYKIDFFNEFILKSDVFLLSRVLHDWSDKKAVQILKNIANNMSDKSVLYVFDTVIPEHSLLDKGQTLSFHLLSFVGGYERSINDFKNIFNKAELNIIDIFFPDNLISIIKVQK